jgi:hypothetical protein
MNPFKEKSVGCAMVAGLVLCGCGGFLTMLFTMGGVFRGVATREPVTDRITDAGTLNLVPLSFAMVAIGVFLALGALGYGLYYSNRGSLKGPRQVVPNARVLGRYGVTRDNVYITDPIDFEVHDRLTYCVMLQLNEYDKAEFRCAPETFWQCGEGMYGEAEIQNKWLGRFTPYIGVATSVLPS